MDEGVILGGLSILFVGMVVLVPVLGLTLRFAIKPFFDSWAEIQRGRIKAESHELLQRQINLLETDLLQVQQTLQGVVETQEFERRLSGPAPAKAQLGSDASGSVLRSHPPG